MSKEMNSFLSIVSDMLITNVDRRVKMTIMSVSYVFSNLRNKNISIIQTNHLQFPEISRKKILELQSLLKKSLILIATFLNKSTNIIATLVTTSSNTQISHNERLSR